jgi:hypothetical protein
LQPPTWSRRSRRAGGVKAPRTRIRRSARDGDETARDLIRLPSRRGVTLLPRHTDGRIRHDATANSSASGGPSPAVHMHGVGCEGIGRPPNSATSDTGLTISFVRSAAGRAAFALAPTRRCGAVRRLGPRAARGVRRGCERRELGVCLSTHGPRPLQRSEAHGDPTPDRRSKRRETVVLEPCLVPTSGTHVNHFCADSRTGNRKGPQKRTFSE